MIDLQNNFEKVRRQIEAACARAGRSPQEVTLVAVSKTVEPEVVLAATKFAKIFGENRPQELMRKCAECPYVDFHFIGNLQRNKVKNVVGQVSLIHSVDSLRLLEAIDVAARKVVQPVLLQINISGEESKNGFSPQEVPAVLELASALHHIRIDGLMTMAPLGDPESTRPCFAQLRVLRDSYGLRELSMGMSNDFEIAIEEGATLVRVGTALF